MRTRVSAAVCVLGVVFIAGCGRIVIEVGNVFNQWATLEVGPLTESWPIQPTDKAASAVLERGHRTAEKRSSLWLVASGSYVDFYSGPNGRLALRWEKAGGLRIDAVGETPANQGEAKGPLKRTWLRPNNHESWYYDFDAKKLTIFDWRGAEKPMSEWSVFRMEPLPWFFRDGKDLARRRWKLEPMDAKDRCLSFAMTPANDQWLRSGEIDLDPQTGMPTRIALRPYFGVKDEREEVVVESVEENPRFDRAVFTPWTPKPEDGWETQRLSMSEKKEAEAVLHRANELDRKTVAAVATIR